MVFDLQIKHTVAHVTVCLSIPTFICLPAFPLCPFICLFATMPITPTFACPSVTLCVHLHVYPSVQLHVCHLETEKVKEYDNISSVEIRVK